MKRLIKPFGFAPTIDETPVETPCVNLGTRIANQMYHGVSPGNSTLLSGQYDDEDNWDVDPACDMNTDRFNFTSKPVERVPDAPPAE